jgi:hypothetical protein
VAADAVSRGSFDDLPDAELRVVLAVPLDLWPAEQAPPSPAAAPHVPAPPAHVTARHRSARLRSGRSPAMDTLRVGLSAALVVVLLVLVALLAVDRFAR